MSPIDPSMRTRGPAELIEVVPLVIRRNQKAALDPVLHGVGFQAGDGGHLAQHNAAAQEHGCELIFNVAGLHAVGLESKSFFLRHFLPRDYAVFSNQRISAHEADSIFNAEPRVKYIYVDFL